MLYDLYILSPKLEHYLGSMHTVLICLLKQIYTKRLDEHACIWKCIKKS